MVRYSTIIYDGSLRYMARLPVISVEAGKVVNDVADAQVEVVPRRDLFLGDAAVFFVVRFEAGSVTQIGGYFVQQTSDKFNNYKRSWVLKGQSPLVLYKQRESGNLSSSLTNAASIIAQSLMDTAFRKGDTYLTVEPTRADGATANATTQTGVLEPLATIKDMARASETNYGMDLRVKVNYDAILLPSANSLTLRPVSWAGEYGADRRIGTGVNPVFLYLSKVANSWEAVDDRSRQVTAIVGTGSSRSYSNPKALENPFGNRKEQSASASSSGASRVNSQSRTKLFEGRPMMKIQVDMSLPPDRFGLGLGDVFSVNVNGAPGTAWLNVIHYSWNSGGESVAGRLDVEIQKWT